MIALSSKNEKRRFNLAYCEIKKAERAEVQRNWHYSPRSTAWASEGERSHAGLRCIKRPHRNLVCCLAELFAMCAGFAAACPLFVDTSMSAPL